MTRCPFCDHENPTGTRRCDECGADLPIDPPAVVADLDDQVRALVARDETIAAIKLYREQTGSHLKEAKDAVEAIAAGAQSRSLQSAADDALKSKVAALLERGQKIEAIKLYRERTGVGLKEAKDAVEALGAGASWGALRQPPADALEDEVVALLERGQKIDAIKIYRARTGASLKDAKDAVEAAAQRRGLAVRRASGCVVAVLLLLGVTACALTFADEQPVAISEATQNADGILVHRVESPYQAGTTEIRVLVPDRPNAANRLPVVYVLPVEAGAGDRYGNGLLEVKRHDLHNRFRALFVAPTFSALPWYADHPTNRTLRQESDLLNVVVPFIERRYPARTDRDGRLLLGFSKSGWGAYSLLLRQPDRFGKAAAWDAPLMQARTDRFGMGPIFGTDANFEAYRITALLDRRAAELKAEREPRLILLGYGNFRDHHRQAHALMVDSHIPHVYRDGPKRPHTWESGWVEEAVGLLLADRRDDGHASSSATTSSQGK